MSDFKIIDLSPEGISQYGVCGYKNATKHEELRNKIAWYAKYFPLGLRIKALISDKNEYLGMIEYMPGEIAHRPVSAQGYFFIQCIFSGFKKEYKGKGLGSMLIENCIAEAKENKKSGVAVVTRKGSFMADGNIFEKLGFMAVDKASPDFTLMVLKFDANSSNPTFLNHKVDDKKYGKGLFVFRSAQCPYSVKNVNEIVKTAKEKLKIEAKIVELETAEMVQASPCAFGAFCIMYNGQIISHHPISNTRFENIMKSLKA